MSRIAVNFRGTQKRVSSADAKRQSGTMRLILEKLRTQPGVVLCDEVGMGKTYVALGVVAQYLMSYPRSRVLILTPSADLAEKWTQDLERFREENVREHVRRAMRPQLQASWRLTDLLGAKDKSRVWVLPISVFFHSHRNEEQREFRLIVYHLISRGGHLPREERKVLWRRLGGSTRSTPRPRKRLYWNGWRVSSFRNRVHALLKQHAPQGFNPTTVTDSALRHIRDDVRWLLIKARLRRFSLIVADEAHHFRNPDTKRYRSLEGVFKGAFRDMLFLTATPFQLGPDELEHIMMLFRLSSERSARHVEEEARRVTDCARQYQDAVRGFERAWQQLSDTEKQAVCEEAKTKTTGIRAFCSAYEHLQSMHATLQNTLSKWVIRNIKDRSYRQSDEGAISLDRMDYLPFAILQRLLYEYQRKKPTFSATENVSLTSSWEAFRGSAVMKGTAVGARSVAFYRKAIKPLVSDNDVAHPKFAKLLGISQNALRTNEKVLVFTSRIATVRALQSKLNPVLEEEIYRDTGLRRHDVEARLQQLRKRATASRDSLWLMFQENYFRTRLKRAPGVKSICDEVTSVLAALPPKHRVGLIGKARGPNWKLLRSICNWVVFRSPNRFRLKHNACAPTDYSSRDNCPEEVDQRKLRGYWPGDWDGGDVLNRHHWTRQQLRGGLSTSLPHKSIWDGYSKDLASLKDRNVRENLLVSITRVLLLPEVVGHAIVSLGRLGRGQTEEAVLQAFDMPAAKDRITRFLSEMRTLPTAEVATYADGLATENLVARASGKERAADRLRHRYGFNTPFRPYVLIASEVMQEGLDLHRECSRIVHYDLAWNPARLEQRVGRIDRLGSRVEKRLRKSKDAKLNIHLHYIPGTIDERMFKVVRDRERWFKFMLGHKPEWEMDTEEHLGPIPLPEKYSTEFRIRLGIKQRP